METIKSYTDISQSKKLTEILPIESSDNHYWRNGYNNYICGLGNSAELKEKFEEKGLKYLPCWSVAALLNVMPQINDWITPHGHKNDKLSQFEPKICKVWEHSIIPSFKVTYGDKLSTDAYDSPIDACVAMIEKLHELKML